MSRPKPLDPPCTARHKFSDSDYEVSCWGRVGHSDPHWAPQGYRWREADEVPT